VDCPSSRHQQVLDPFTLETRPAAAMSRPVSRRVSTHTHTHTHAHRPSFQWRPSVNILVTVIELSLHSSMNWLASSSSPFIPTLKTHVSLRAPEARSRRRKPTAATRSPIIAIQSCRVCFAAFYSAVQLRAAPNFVRRMRMSELCRMRLHHAADAA